MARVEVDVTPLGYNGSVNAAAVGVYQDADSTDDMFVEAHEGKLLLHVKNTNAAARNITIVAGAGGHQSAAWMGVLGNLVVNIPALTGDVIIGPLETARFEQTDGTIYLNFDASADCTIAAFSLP